MVELFEALLLTNLHGVLPKSLLGQALHYLSSQWGKLKRYVEDGRYCIDNNVQENASRPFCVGRRNWLFADTVHGANASANLYSLVQTCRVDGIDGYRYELPRSACCSHRVARARQRSAGSGPAKVRRAVSPMRSGAVGDGQRGRR